MECNQENVLRELATSFSPGNILNWDTCNELCRSMIALQPDSISETLPLVLYSLINFYTLDVDIEHEVDMIIDYLTIDDTVDYEMNVQLFGKQNADEFVTTKDFLSKIKLSHWQSFSTEQRWAVSCWLDIVRSWDKIFIFSNHIDAAANYWSNVKVEEHTNSS